MFYFFLKRKVFVINQNIKDTYDGKNKIVKKVNSA